MQLLASLGAWGDCMKIRVMGTREECEQAQHFYTQLSKGDNVISSSVSGLYPNRGSTNQYRVYVEILCKSEKMNIYCESLPEVQKMDNENTCGSCLWFVDGFCYANTCYGEVSNHSSSEPSCKHFDLPNALVNKSIVEDLATTFKELRARFGRDVCCEDCFWFCPHTDNELKGICSRTRFDFEYYAKACACRKFEPRK